MDLKSKTLNDPFSSRHILLTDSKKQFGFVKQDLI